MEKFNLWETIPCEHSEIPSITYYKPENKTTDSAVVIFPGGGYGMRAEHEGKGYAEFFNQNGITAFVVDYRVHPDKFPAPILDARRSIRYVRYHAKRFGINPDKLAVIGSSAGGHLAMAVNDFDKPLESENTDVIDKLDFHPDFRILVYPVIALSDLAITHIGSAVNLLGDEQLERTKELDGRLTNPVKMPPTFIWHTSDDAAVNVKNSLAYGMHLRDLGVPFEMHIFPNGPHGLGLAESMPHVAKWSGLMLDWLNETGFYD